MLDYVLIALAILAMAGALLLIPVGIPGLWIMLGVLAVATVLGEVPVWLLAVLLAAGVTAEVLEYALVKRMSARYGGSNRAFWGALLGGLVGVFVGVPVPVVGSLIGGVLGSFAGATGVAYFESRKVKDAARVGWGAVLGLATSAAFKTALGIVILVVGTTALLWR